MSFLPQKATWFLPVATLALVLAAVAGWLTTRDATARTPRAATRAHGVWWPGELPEVSERERTAALRRARELEVVMRGPVQPVPLAQPAVNRVGVADMAAMSVALGDLETAVNVTEPEDDEASSQPQSIEQQSFRAAALLARGYQKNSTTDLLDAAEMLARIEGDVAAACNRVELWEYLGLSYRAKELSKQCPFLAEHPIKFKSDEWGGKRVSANDLPEGEEAAVTELLDRGDRQAAKDRIWKRAQAWRVYLEREGLQRWVQVANDPVKRVEHEEHLRRIAEVYGEATGNPAPLRLVGELAGLHQTDLVSAFRGIGEWVEGARQLAEFQGEPAASHLARARGAAEAVLPTLGRRIVADEVRARFNLGDNEGVIRGARALQTMAAQGSQESWLHARALQLESLGLVGKGDWEGTLRSADLAEPALLVLGEKLIAAGLGLHRTLAFSALAEPNNARASIADTMRRMAALDETRYLAAAESALARAVAREGQPLVAVEAQREALRHDLNDGNAAAIADSQALLAEVLAVAGDSESAREEAAAARSTASGIASATARERTLALLNQVESELSTIDNHPEESIRKVDQFLRAFGDFGDRFRRPEAYLTRADALIRLGRLEEAQADLGAAIAEITTGSLVLTDPLRAAAVLGGVRKTLERLTQTLLDLDEHGLRALAVIEYLRALQEGLALDREPRRAQSKRPRLPGGVCATEYFALPGQLLAWTFCGPSVAVLTRTEVSADTLEQLALSIQERAIAEDLPGLRRVSRALSHYLVDPQANELKAATRWVVVPDAPMSKIPVAWLMIAQRFAFEERTVAITPMLGALGARPPSNQSWRVLAAGDAGSGTNGWDRLEGAFAEVDDISRLLARSGGEATTVTTFAGLQAALGQSSAFHYAGHVGGGPNGPQGAYLQFAPDRDHPEGRVTLKEIARLPLSGVELAFLAACSSANTGTMRLAGSLGFAAAFLRGGAKQAVGTLWAVPDHAQRAISGRYYTSLLSGRTPSEALREVWLSEISGPNATQRHLAASVPMVLLTTTLEEKRQ